MLKQHSQRIKTCVIPIVAGVIYAFAIKYFIMPSGIIMTGTEGIALASSYFFESDRLFILLYIIFQFLLLIFSFVKIGKIFSIKTMLTLVTVSLLLIFLPSLEVASPEPENERLVLVLFGAIVSGIGKALSLMNRGSTGDEDIIGVYFSEKLRKPVGTISIVAGIISMSYGLLLNYLKYHDVGELANTLIYTVIFVFVGASTVNEIYKRYRFSNVTINTNRPFDVIRILQQIFPDRTFTKSTVIGGFSQRRRTIINVIVTQEELPHIMNEVSQLEGNNFIYHHEIDNIQGRFVFQQIK
ncbi:YitT family protein [Spirochaeta cellobiosiphila]|uniref:YitT family protein n=1 Tax=Spirochaeta cellobiosiphila TaxID=504483 RepID=UPI000427ABC3|nr:YitT family protein [Spirochaeta cellobiosiphila]